MASNPLVRMVDVSKSFSRKAVLKNCSLDVDEGKTVVLVGPSGAGKSTLLRCINLIENIDGGKIFFKNVDITGERRSAYLIRQRIGMVFQNFELFPHLTSVENIMLAPNKVLGHSKKDAHDLALSFLAKVHLAEKADAYPEELSGGQQQRVAIARALAMGPSVVLYDEPTSALDPEMIREVLDVMGELSADGMTAIAVTHEMGFAKRSADLMVFMEDGRILERVDKDSFFAGRVGERTKRFVDHIFH